MKNIYLLLITCLLTINVHAQWLQRGADLNGEAAQDRSGWRVSMNSNGNIVAIGGYLNDGNGADAGHVRVYELSGSTWIQKGADIDGEAAGDESGRSVSLSADGLTLAIGAPRNDDGLISNTGHARIYEWSGSAWTQKGTDINGEAADDHSGHTVSISSDGNSVAMGAPFNDGTGSSVGHVRVFEWNGSAWTQKGTDIDGEAADDQSGSAISLNSDGSTLAIGASRNDDAGSSAGHARIYEWSGSAWTQKGIDIDGEAAGDGSGSSVSMSSNGNTVAIGATGNDGTASFAGHARIYEWSGSAWTQKGTDIDGEAAEDQSGYSVSLSSDGNNVAIGAFGNDGTASFAGHVRVYEWNGSAWAQLFGDIDGEATFDQTGISVQMSSDGSALIAGAFGNDAAALNAGYARIFATPTSTLPIELVSFSAHLANHNSVKLTWQTASEINNDFFTIERSINAVDWERITDVDGAGNSSTLLQYSTEDKTPYDETSYYRLKQTDFDGKFAYSQISSVHIDGLENGMLIYPNPTDGNLDIDLGANYESISLTILDVNGTVIQLKTYNQSQLLNIKLEGPSGVYVLVVTADNRKAEFRLIKE